MEDSFFGFNTELPGDRRGDREDEDEYDALNDETFGSATNGDWETQHESLVRLDDGKIIGGKKTKSSNGNGIAFLNDYDDLELNLSSVKLDDVIVPYNEDDEQSEIKLDPSVWSNASTTSNKFGSPAPNIYNYQQQQMSPRPTMPSQSHNQQNIKDLFALLGGNSTPKKINTLEDIERGIKEKQIQQNLLQAATKTPKSQLSPQQPQTPTPNASRNGSFVTGPPPGFTTPPVRNPNFNMPPQMHQQQQQQQGMHRMPPGGFPPFPPHGNMPMRPISNLPIALNNFAMHPSFNAMRPINGPPMQMPFQQVQNQQQYNQQLLHEIQRNHPLLGRQHHHMAMLQQHLAAQQQHMLHQMHAANNNKNNSNNNNNNNKRNQRNNEEYDEYANLMSTRDKHWLIGIQLSQLNSDTPYIDDYYYTTYRERKAKKFGEITSRTHKDNQLNHPLTQPKGQHAKLVMVQLGNKNGNRNGQNNHRERRNSENNNGNKDNNNLKMNSQFENSLGKLQYGSVTAPRKLIDMAIDPIKVRTTTDENQLQQITAAASVEISSQRKYRLILLHIETLYKIVLKLEDSVNPSAIAAYAALKEKNQLNTEASTTTTDTNAENSETASKPTPAFELEPKEKLIDSLLPGLAQDKIIGMMNVRKGRNMIARILPHIDNYDIRWDIWIGVLYSINNTSNKKDKDENGEITFTLFYPEFKKQIQFADLAIINKLAQTIQSAGENEKKSINLFSNKFLISCLVALILKAENLYDAETNEMLKENWSQFLQNISTLLSKTIQNHVISVAIESDAIDPMRQHFSRFHNLALDPLMKLISQNEN